MLGLVNNIIAALTAHAEVIAGASPGLSIRDQTYPTE